MKNTQRALIIGFLAISLQACSWILKEGSVVVPRNKERGACLTYPYGPCTPFVSSPIQACRLNPDEEGIIREFSLSPSVGSIVRVEGTDCSGWTARSNVESK